MNKREWQTMIPIENHIDRCTLIRSYIQKITLFMTLSSFHNFDCSKSLAFFRFIYFLQFVPNGCGVSNFKWNLQIIATDDVIVSDHFRLSGKKEQKKTESAAYNTIKPNN